MSEVPDDVWESDDCVRRMLVLPAGWPNGSRPRPSSVGFRSVTCWSNTRRMAWTTMEPMDRDQLAGYPASSNPNPFFP